MKPVRILLTYLSSLTDASVRLLAVGLLPILLALAFVLAAVLSPSSSVWLMKSFAFWVDSIGVSFLLLLAGVALLDYAEKHDASDPDR